MSWQLPPLGTMLGTMEELGMTRTGLRIVLVASACLLTTVMSCISPANWSAEPEDAPPGERISALESQIEALEAEIETLDTDAAAGRIAQRNAEAAAMAAKETLSEAQADTARAEAAAERAQGRARAAAKAQTAAEDRAEDAEARAADAEARVADAKAMLADTEARAADAEARLAAAKAMLAETQARMAAELAAKQSEIDLLLRDAKGRPIAVPSGLDLSRVNLESAEVSRAGPDAIYISRIGYGDQEYAALVRYTGDNEAILEALYDSGAGGLPIMDFSTPALAVVPPNELVISNVGVRGAAYAIALQVRRNGTITFVATDQGHRVRTSAELKRDDLLTSATANRLVHGFRAGKALPGEGSWTPSGRGAVVRQTDVEASHAKFAFAGVVQSAVPTLYGLTARTNGGERVGYGLHFLASETPKSGNTWNYGRSYLMWVTYEPGFFGSDEVQVQLYESLDDNQLVWLNSTNIAQSLAHGLTLETLYDPGDCPEMMEGHACYGSMAVLVDGNEQFKVAVSQEMSMRMADTVALRVLGGPVEFTDLYVHSR